MNRAVEFDEEKKTLLKEILQMKQKNTDGFIDCQDIPIAFTAMGYNVSESELEPLLTLYDTNNDKRLHIDEILDNLEMIKISPTNRQTEGQTRDAFAMFDRLEDGHIREHAFIQVLTANVSDYKFSIPEAKHIWKEMVEMYDTDEENGLAYNGNTIEELFLYDCKLANKGKQARKSSNHRETVHLRLVYYHSKGNVTWDDRAMIC